MKTIQIHVPILKSPSESQIHIFHKSTFLQKRNLKSLITNHKSRRCRRSIVVHHPPSLSQLPSSSSSQRPESTAPTPAAKAEVHGSSTIINRHHRLPPDPGGGGSNIPEPNDSGYAPPEHSNGWSSTPEHGDGRSASPNLTEGRSTSPNLGRSPCGGSRCHPPLAVVAVTVVIFKPSSVLAGQNWDKEGWRLCCRYWWAPPLPPPCHPPLRCRWPSSPPLCCHWTPPPALPPFAIAGLTTLRERERVAMGKRKEREIHVWWDMGIRIRVL